MISVNSVQDYFDTLPVRFVASASKGINAIFEFNMTGDGGGVWLVTVDNGNLNILKVDNEKLRIPNDVHSSPSVKLKMNAHKYVKMVNGELDGKKAYAKFELKVTGNMKLAQRMERIFPHGEIGHRSVEDPRIDLKIGSEKSNVERFAEYIHRMIQSDFTALDELTSPNLITHASPRIILKAFEGVTSARHRERIFFEQLAQAFSEIQFILNQKLVFGNNMVAINYTIRGVHNKNLFFDVAPSGQEEKIDGTAILRFENGKIVEHWGGPNCETCTGYVRLENSIFKEKIGLRAIDDSKVDPQIDLAKNHVELMVEYTRRMIEGDFTALNDLTSPEWFTHASPRTILDAFEGVACARDGERIFFEQLTQAFSNRQLILNQNLASGDLVAINYTILGIHDNGRFFDIPPSNQEEKIDGTAILRFANGKIVEHWGGPNCPACTGYVGLEI